MELTIGLFSNISPLNVFVCHPKVLFAVMLRTYTAWAVRNMLYAQEWVEVHRSPDLTVGKRRHRAIQILVKTESESRRG